MVSSRRGQAVQGTGLAFIVYTEAIKNMEVSQLWSALYFFMLLMLGVGSMLGNTAAILTPLTDSKVISSHLPKEAISGERAGPGRGWASGREACRGTWAGGLPRGPCAPGGGHGGCRHLTAVPPPPSPRFGQSGASAGESRSPHHGEVKRPPQGQSPRPGPRSAPGSERAAFVCFN